MKGIILAGGLGTRLYPLTWATNKHLLPIYDQPMVFYPIQTLVRAGIKDIMIVTGGPHAGHFVQVLRIGKELGIHHLEFAFQETVEVNGKRIEGGIAHALSLCEDFADNGPIAVILGDNTTDANISDAVNSYKKGAKVFLKKVPDPHRFGVPVFDKNQKDVILNIEKNPNYKFVKVDIAKANDVETVVKQGGIDVIVNFAAQTHVDRALYYSYE